MNKRLPAILAAAALSLTLAACGGSSDDADQTTSEPSSSIVEAPETAKPSPEPTTAPVASEAPKWDEATKTMTLTSSEVTGALEIPGDAATIKLVGDSTINLDAKSDKSAYGIDTEAVLTVVGDGSLTIKVTNTDGNAGGIRAKGVSVELGDDGVLSIAAESAYGGALGIFSDQELAIVSGLVDIEVDSDATETQTVGAYSGTANVEIGEKAQVIIIAKGNHAGETGGIVTATGQIVVDGELTVIATNAGTSRALTGQAGVRFGETSRSVLDVTSTGGTVIAMSSTDGDIHLSGTIDVKAKAKAAATAALSVKRITGTRPKITVEVESTSATETETEHKGSSGGVSYRPDPARGFYSTEGVSLSGGTIDISVKSQGNAAFGILTSGPVSLDTLHLTIDASAKNSEVFGIFSSYKAVDRPSGTGISMNFTAATISTTGTAVASQSKMALTRTGIPQGYVIGVRDGWSTIDGTDGEPAPNVAILPM